MAERMRTGPTVADLRQRVGVLEAEPHECAEALEAEASARETVEKRLAERQTKLAGTLVLPAGLSLAVGKTVRTCKVADLRAGDDMTVTPKAALPAGVALAETYCLVDGTLTVALVATALVTIGAKAEIPLGVVALR